MLLINKKTKVKKDIDNGVAIRILKRKNSEWEQVKERVEAKPKAKAAKTNG